MRIRTPRSQLPHIDLSHSIKDSFSERGESGVAPKTAKNKFGVAKKIRLQKIAEHWLGKNVMQIN